MSSISDPDEAGKDVSGVRQSAELEVLAFCEPSSATVRSKEHIRVVGPEGFKYGGGIPTPALCGYDLRHGWDLKVTVHPTRFLPNAEINPTCERCVDAYWERATPPGSQRTPAERPGGAE